jgi:hypothetical protein
MPDATSHPLQVWQNFYLLIGTASATLAGLMFVAISLGSRLMTSRNIPALRVFVSPTLIHFVYVLVTTAVVLIPTLTRALLGTLLVLAGLVSLGWTLSALPYMRRSSRDRLIDTQDWVWYLLAPWAAYLLYVATGAGLLLGAGGALNGLAAASILLLVTGIRNAWDLVVFFALSQGAPPDGHAEAPGRGEDRATAERRAEPAVQLQREDDEEGTSLVLPPPDRADVARAIQEAGLNPGDFTWAVQPSRHALIGPLVSALIHRPTGWYFRFEFTERAGRNRVSVFVAGEGAREVRKAAASWEEQLGQVRAWLSHLAGARK